MSSTNAVVTSVRCFSMNVADRLAEKIEQRGDEIEPHAARQQRGDAERQQIEMRRAARDRDELVGDRRHPFDQDDPKAPFVELLLELREPALQSVKIDQPLARTSRRSKYPIA